MSNQKNPNNLIGNGCSQDIIFYGERGVVNGIVLDIKDDTKKQMEFIRSIKFLPEYADTMAWRYEDFKLTWLIEPSFSMFGNPDLIVIAKTDDGSKYVFFIEVKLDGYDASSLIIDKEKLTADFEHNASKLNMQLALRYRFVKAFTCGSISDQEIREIDEFSPDKKRYIRNRIVIDYCNDYLSDTNEYYFVALTNDKRTQDPFESLDTLPPLGSEEWGKGKGKFGLVTYNDLEYKKIIERSSGYYGIAASLMLGQPANSIVQNSGTNLKLLKTKNRINWDDQQKLLYFYVHAALSVKYQSYIKEYEGSTSLIIQDTTFLKYFANPNDKNQLMIALRDDNIQKEILQDFEPFNLGVGDNVKPFRVYVVNSEKEFDDFKKQIEIYVDKHLSHIE